MANYFLLPVLRSKRLVALDRIHEMEADIRTIQRAILAKHSEIAEIDRMIREHDYYKPPPRPP